MSDDPTPSMPPSQSSDMTGRLGRLMLKELREILRDRRTIVTLVLMPLLVYPLLSIGFRQFFLTRVATKARPMVVGFATQAEGQAFRTFLAEHRAWEDRGNSHDKDESPAIELSTFDDVARAVHDGIADLGIRMRNLDLTQSRNLAIDVEFIFLEDYAPGERAADYFEHAVARANVEFLQQRLSRMGVGQRADPVRVKRREIKSASTVAGVSLLTVLPLILILMTITGAVYPAIDLTAGERERGTLEILVAAPVPRLGLLLAKYVSVLAVALLTATVNLVTMSVTISLSGMGSTLLGERGLSLVVVIEVFALLVLFAGFFSAVLLSLTSFARSFKEAQAYLIPLMLLSLGPGLLSLVPGLKLQGFLAVAPLINIVLLGRDLLEQNADPLMATIVVLTNFLYASAAIAAAARVFGSEDVLFNVQSSWSDWFHRPLRPRPAPTVGTAMFCLALIFPAFFVITNAVGQATDWSLKSKLVLSGIGTALLFAGFPLIAAWLRRDPVRGAFQLHRPPVLAIPAAIVSGLSLWPWAHEIVIWQHELGLFTLDETHFERVRELLDKARSELSLPAMLVTMALLPGLCEEFFFRGYLFRALRTRLSGRATILASALLFGLFHLVTVDALAVERFLPSTLLGLVLGWVCLRSGSVIPGMLLHVCHNGLLITLAWNQTWLAEQGFAMQEQSHLPASWLAYSALAVLVGMAPYFFFISFGAMANRTR